MVQSTGNARVKDIAKALGLSIGTVDRALHDRQGINPLTRQRVLAMAETLGYRPNVAARYLRSKKQLTISVNLPRGVATFFDAVREGIRSAAAPSGMAVRLDFRTCRRLGDGDARLLEDAINEGASGIIVAPGNPAEMKPLIRRAARQKIPVVCVVTDAPGTERLAGITADAYTNGAMVAELLARFRPSGGQVGVVTGCLDILDHAEKLKGFKETLTALQAPLELVRVIEAHDDAREALVQTRAMLEKHRRLAAVYVCTSNSVSVLKAVERAGRSGELAVVTTDLFPDLVPLLRSGTVWATMYQRPLNQGRLAFDTLYRFLVEGRCPAARIKLLPHVIMRSNLDMILQRLPMV